MSWIRDRPRGTTIQGTNVPGRVTQRVHTTVEMETGQTFVIGGLIQRNVRATLTKVPIVGDAPFLGTLFSRKEFFESEEELVILVTPYLVDPLACNQVPKLLPGQETRSPDDFELFLEGIIEAPRGQRFACQGFRYVPAHKEGPTAGMFPCGGRSWGHGPVRGPNPGPYCPEPAGLGSHGGHLPEGVVHQPAPQPAPPAPPALTLPSEDVRPTGGLDLTPPPGDRPTGGEGQP